GMAAATVVLSGDGRGLDCLPALLDRQLPAKVFADDAGVREALRETYPAAWDYAPIDSVARCAGAPLWIVEARGDGLGIDPVAFGGAFPRRVLVAVSEAGLIGLGCLSDAPAPIARAFSRLLGRPLACRGVHFRHGYPEDSVWVWLEPA